jgi:hypothetical protein
MCTIRPILAMPPHIARPILVVLVVEWLVWLFLTHFLPNLLRCSLERLTHAW